MTHNEAEKILEVWKSIFEKMLNNIINEMGVYPGSGIDTVLFLKKIDELIEAAKTVQRYENAEMVKHTRDCLQGGLYNDILKVIFDETIKKILHPSPDAK